MIQCGSCRLRLKSVVLSRCGHLFCKECIEARLANRSRKCPVRSLLSPPCPSRPPILMRRVDHCGSLQIEPPLTLFTTFPFAPSSSLAIRPSSCPSPSSSAAIHLAARLPRRPPPITSSFASTGLLDFVYLGRGSARLLRLSNAIVRSVFPRARCLAEESDRD